MVRVSGRVYYAVAVAVDDVGVGIGVGDCWNPQRRYSYYQHDCRYR